MAEKPSTEKLLVEGKIRFCIRCDQARFPQPTEQCYKFGGLICTVDNHNVGKYDRCRFGLTNESKSQSSC